MPCCSSEPVTFTRADAVDAGWGDSLHPLRLKGRDEFITVISLVHCQCLGTFRGELQQGLRLPDVTGLSASQDEVQRVSQSIGDRLNVDEHGLQVRLIDTPGMDFIPVVFCQQNLSAQWKRLCRSVTNEYFCLATLGCLPQIISELTLKPTFRARSVEPCLQAQRKIDANPCFTIQNAGERHAVDAEFPGCLSN